MAQRTNPYGQALTYDEWLIASALKGRPLTDDPIKLRTQQDARRSRLVQPIPRKRTTPIPKEAAA